MSEHFERGNCTTGKGLLFHEEYIEQAGFFGEQSYRAEQLENLAKSYCNTCKVIGQCMIYAIYPEDDVQIIAGMNRVERHAYRARQI